MHDKAAFEAIPEGERLAARGIEVGHIFYFGTKYSKPMNAVVAGPDGEQVTVEMGSYGIGVSRLVGAIIEASHDEAGIVWPEAWRRSRSAIDQPASADDARRAAAPATSSTTQLGGAGRRGALRRPRRARPGAKFADMDLIGMPWQVIVGPKGIAAGKVEMKNRKTGEREELPLDQVVARFG